ncbi:sporulation protein [Oceanospirillum sediminis]|uniref:Sporulation protein n=1 Tax=Oceanospirillum sediminis TaxID=2760088 RepID=A0A839IX47_9GAMM|nr:sporulation protein [Oceanospirillum sediminis]MBB1489029.1 sporulation protein [Oceanospirillum sediminis]
MFKKLLASVGIGGAKVDTILTKEVVSPGDTISANIVITGGDTEQEISGLDLALMTRVKVERDDTEMVINKPLAQWHIADKFVIQPGEIREIPFEGSLPWETPVSSNGARNNQTRVWIATGLNIDMAIDASDKDPLNIIPTPTQNKVLQAMDNCGYTIFKADVEEGQLRGHDFASTTGCYQELEYRPNEFALFGLNEVEVSFVASEHVTHVLLELDRNFGGDSYRSLTLPNNISLEEVTAQLKSLLG